MWRDKRQLTCTHMQIHQYPGQLAANDTTRRKKSLHAIFTREDLHSCMHLDLAYIYSLQRAMDAREP